MAVMPQTPERKRVYMREYMRRKHGFSPRQPKRVVKGNLVPLTKGNLVPVSGWANMLVPPKRNFSPYRPADRGWANTGGVLHMMDYLRYIHARGYALEQFAHPRGGPPRSGRGWAYRFRPASLVPCCSPARRGQASGAPLQGQEGGMP